MADILIRDFPMSLNGRWGTCSDHIVIHGNGSVTYIDGHNFENAKAMEVVRCKDCEHDISSQFDAASRCNLWGCLKPKRGFCDAGKRREK